MSSRRKVPKRKSTDEKIARIINESDTSDEEEEKHELSFYVNDRVKLMKQVLKIIKPKRMKSMAPECLQEMDLEEINSLLLEELLGISNKRLKYIFSGENPGEDSSSTDPDNEKQIIDIISLDDVSDDDLIIIDSDIPKHKKKKSSTNSNKESPRKKIKKEKSDKSRRRNLEKNKDKLVGEENLMSVLELLELQARARAIKSQLILETARKEQQQENSGNTNDKNNTDSDSDSAVIALSPKNEEIVITSSDSEIEIGEQNESQSSSTQEAVLAPTISPNKKIILIRDRIIKQKDLPENQINAENIVPQCSETVENGDAAMAADQEKKNEDPTEKSHEKQDSNTEDKPEESTNEAETSKDEKVDTKNAAALNNSVEDDGDEIILIVDQEEIDNIIGAQ